MEAVPQVFVGSNHDQVHPGLLLFIIVIIIINK